MDIGIIVIQVIALFMALTFHEFAHGWVARKLGDRTAEAQGRLTLNPIAHIDPFGTVILPLMLIFMSSPVVIGWAKPVPINPGEFRNPRKGMMWSALGGPVINVVLAAACGVLFVLLRQSGIEPEPLMLFLQVSVLLNLVLALFNMIPIPPLDGGRVLVGLLPPEQAYAYNRIERYGFLIVIGLLYFDILDRFLFYPVAVVMKLLGIR